MTDEIPFVYDPDCPPDKIYIVNVQPQAKTVAGHATFTDVLMEGLDDMAYTMYRGTTQMLFGQDQPVLSKELFEAHRRVTKAMEARHKECWGRTRSRRLISRLFSARIMGAYLDQRRVVSDAFYGDASLPEPGH
jgi:hypothetical protein